MASRLPLAWLISKKRAGIGLALFAAFFTWSSIDFNGKVPLDDWKSDLRADAGGYYIYLPGLFHHGMHAATIPDSLLEVAGHGFTVDRERDRIITKYTCGPAILMLPFFLIAEIIAGPGSTDGWTRTHHQAIEVAGIFYWTLGLFLLIGALQRWMPTAALIALLVFLSIAFGTNTFYYAFRSAGYSHVYSFFLVCLALYAVYADPDRSMQARWRWAFLIACALLVLIRPIDVVAVLALFGLLWMARPEEIQRPLFYVRGAVIALLIAAPQLIYWRFAYGSWVVYSYGAEGFDNWASPFWKEVLFAPCNGLIPYAPVLILLPFGLIALWVRSAVQGALITSCILLVLYACSAWHSWHFGCSYGMRPFVQYTPFAAMALWALFARLRERAVPVLRGLVPLLVLVCFINYRAMLQYDVCYVVGDWEWSSFGRNLLEAFFGKGVF